MLYHRRIGFPTNVELPRGIHRIRYSEHAIKAAATDYIICLPMAVDFSKVKLIELEVINDKATKAVVRIPQGDYHLVLALTLTQFGPLTCRTVWENHKFDNHKTLRRSAYAAA